MGRHLTVVREETQKVTRMAIELFELCPIFSSYTLAILVQGEDMSAALFLEE